MMHVNQRLDLPHTFESWHSVSDGKQLPSPSSQFSSKCLTREFVENPIFRAGYIQWEQGRSFFTIVKQDVGTCPQCSAEAISKDKRRAAEDIRKRDFCEYSATEQAD
jgi:hypothetical protein